jgi:hypothetical protein
VGPVVCLHPGDELSAAGGQARVESLDQPSMRSSQDLKAPISGAPVLQYLRRPVARSIIDCHNLEVLEALLDEASEAVVEELLAVVDRK